MDRGEWNYVQWWGPRPEGDWSGSEVLSGLSKGSKVFRRVQRCFEGFKDVSRDVRGFKEVRRALKGVSHDNYPPFKVMATRRDGSARMGINLWGRNECVRS